jgi:hypothetical protein
MVPSRQDEVADETLIAVDNEVAPKFFRLLVAFYQLRGRCGFEITSRRLLVVSAQWPQRTTRHILTRTMTGTRPQSRLYVRTAES